MAAVLRVTFSGLIQGRNLTAISSGLQSAVRNSHILRKENDEDKIVLAENGSTIVCWHPAPTFPYECSLPLPAPSETKDVNSVLRAQSEDVQEVFHVTKPQLQREYLQKVTATTKHRWFPRKQIRFAKKTKPDREYL